MPANSDFDDEFSSARQWVEMYRANGLQAVPAVTPREDPLNYKRPALAWKEFENEPIPEETIDRWYGHAGPHRMRTNVGLITGQCSGGIFCVDLDVKEGSQADAWWQGLLEVHNSGLEPETPWQRTGGGGRQFLFRAPAGWVSPTFKTPIGIDIRGQGGFMVAPPSMHASGKRYAWAAGAAPYEVTVEDAPDWLIEAIETLREAHGGSPTGERRERVASAESKNAFGLDVDDREQKLRDMVWAAVVDLYRDCPIEPPAGEQDETKARLWQQYLSSTKSRLQRADASNADLLEAEGRGWSELDRKWRYAMKKWSKEVRIAAAVERAASPNERAGNVNSLAVRETYDLETGEIIESRSPRPVADKSLFEVLSIEDLDNLPDAQWLFKDAIPASALGFFYGPPGSFKSFLCYDLALRTAYGLPLWIDREATAGGGVLYISSEGISGAKHRIRAWKQANKVSGPAPFHLIRKTINFMSADDVDRLERTFLAHVAIHGPIALVFVDTVSRVLPGADENLQKDMTVFIAACDRLRDYGCTVVGVHHTNKAGEMRGSTVFLGQGDFVFRVDRNEKTRSGVLTCDKQKEAEDGWKRAFEVTEEHWVPDGKLEAVSSLVVTYGGEVETEDVSSGWPTRDVCKDVLRSIDEASRAVSWSPYPQTRSTGRYAVHNISTVHNLDFSTVKMMLEEWQRTGILAFGEVDSHSKTMGLRVAKWLD